jgi:hypothetical protein
MSYIAAIYKLAAKCPFPKISKLILYSISFWLKGQSHEKVGVIRVWNGSLGSNQEQLKVGVIRVWNGSLGSNQEQLLFFYFSFRLFNSCEFSMF